MQPSRAWLSLPILSFPPAFAKKEKYYVGQIYSALAAASLEVWWAQEPFKDQSPESSTQKLTPSKITWIHKQMKELTIWYTRSPLFFSQTSQHIEEGIWTQ